MLQFSASQKLYLFHYKWILSFGIDFNVLRSNEMTQIYLANWKKNEFEVKLTSSYTHVLQNTCHVKNVSTFANTDNDIYLGEK